MKARGADARGVAVIDDKTPESELDAMGRAGVSASGSTWRLAHQRPASAASGSRRQPIA